jgi:excisionase family DNA binding protein
VARSWVYGAARRGELPSVRCGRYRRFDERDIERWIDAQRNANGPAASGWDVTHREGAMIEAPARWR